ncbi:hypothetical protein [Mammaliicoccus lentus]|uniref:hypothetical protein n=1 Tax=Mammaliicoccus lentus TaxID=42858 RepID=UPI003519AB22
MKAKKKNIRWDGIVENVQYYKEDRFNQIGDEAYLIINGRDKVCRDVVSIIAEQ